MSDQTEGPDLRTTGERRVGIQFNPSNEDVVFQLKQKGAQLIDLIDQTSGNPAWDNETQREFGRLKSLAMTEIEHGIMDAVKMATT